MKMDAQRQYEAWHSAMASVEAAGAATLHPWHRTALKLLPDLNGKRVIEVGCGRGDFAMLLACRYPTATITAVDFAQTAIEVAKSRGAAAGSKVQFEVADATAMRFPNDAFDYVISCECLEHIPEPQKMANEISRVLRAGGAFLVTTENYFNGLLLAWLHAWLRGVPFNSGSGVQPHENFFLFWKVRRLLEGSGLRIAHTESNHFQWLLLPRVSPASLCTRDFTNPALKQLAKPFGRHFSFVGTKPL